MFCPNCGTENEDSATTCKKCGFNLKGAAAPKFKGTMLMMNSPAGAPRPPAPGAPPGGAPPGGSPPGAPPGTLPGGPAAPGVPAAGRSQLKGTMLGVAPPSLGGQPFGQGPSPGAPHAGHGAPPGPYGAPNPAPSPGAPTPPGVNPLGGTMVADASGGFNPYGGAYGAPPQAPGGAPPPGQPPGFGHPGNPPGQPPAYGAPGSPPQHPGFGAPPPGGYGSPPGAGFPPPGGYGAHAPGQQPHAQGGYGPQPGGYGQQPSPGGFAPAPAHGAPQPGYGAGGVLPGSAPITRSGGRGPVGKVRNPVMVLVLGWLCFVYAFIEGAAMLKELRAFRGKDDINLLFFLIPILNLIEIWKLPAKVLEAKQMAGVPNPEVVHPVLYLFLGIYFLPNDLNEVWQAAGGGPPR